MEEEWGDCSSAVVAVVQAQHLFCWVAEAEQHHEMARWYLCSVVEEVQDLD